MGECVREEEMNLKKFPLEEATDSILLTRLMEECAETIKAASKIIRFGWDALDPDEDYTPNSWLLQYEMRDVELAIAEVRRRMKEAGRFNNVYE